jgi:2-hydroxymuconate-semialdehyde hydrolase
MEGTMNDQHAVLDGLSSIKEHPRASSVNTLRRRMMRGVAVEGRCLRIGETETSVLEAGDGPPIVLLHGGIECGGVYWAPVISGLAERFRVIVPDVPGLGESTPVARMDSTAFANWFAALLELTCSERPTVVDHSLLGSFAAIFAAEHSHLLRRLVIYGAPGIGPYRMPVGLIVTAIRFDLWPSERNHERFQRWAFLDRDRTRARDPDWFKAFSSYLLSRAIVPHVKRTMRQLLKAGTRQVPDATLARIQTPIGLLLGRHDRMAPLRLAEVASAKFGWPLHVVEESGHVPHLEQPERFLTALRGALGTAERQGKERKSL